MLDFSSIAKNAFYRFGRLGHRIIEANFNESDLSSDGGLMLLRQVDQRIELTHAAAAELDDARAPEPTTHTRDMLAQRMDALCGGMKTRMLGVANQAR